MGSPENLPCNFELAGDITVTGFQIGTIFLKMSISSKTFPVTISKMRYDYIS